MRAAKSALLLVVLSIPAAALQRQSFVMKSPKTQAAQAVEAPAPVVVAAPESSPAPRRRPRPSRQRRWRRGAWVWEEVPEPAPHNFDLMPFHAPDLRDSVAAEKPAPKAPPARRYLSGDGTRMILVSGEGRKASLYDVAGIGEPVWLADLGGGVENAAFVESSEDAPLRIILFLPDDALRRFDSDGNPQI